MVLEPGQSGEGFGDDFVLLEPGQSGEAEPCARLPAAGG